MLELDKKEMLKVVGGEISGTLINAVSKFINTLYELGRGAGSAIRRLAEDSFCPLN